LSRKLFHSLVSINDVERILSRYIKLEPLGVEEKPVLEAYGRILAEDIYSPIDHPPFDRSEVDGYAVRAEDTYGADEEHPAILIVTGSIRVGEKPSVEVRAGEAAEIATGAMIPRGANAVVMEEYTERRSGRVLVYRGAAPGENIAHAGSDIAVGDIVLRRGTMLEPKHIGLLSGLGLSTVKVYRAPRVSVFSTGDEVIAPGGKLSEGKVYDVNSYLVVSTLRSIGVEAFYEGHLPDVEDVVRKRISEALEKSDVVVTSGGTSAGLGDMIYRVFDSLGKPGVVIHGLKVKPGKPTVIAVIDGKLAVGLPGFPLSSTMIFHRVVAPLIARLAGYRINEEKTVKARFPYRMRVGKGRAWLIPVYLVEGRSGMLAYPVTTSSGAISPLGDADGYIHVDEKVELLEEGDEVIVRVFPGYKGASDPVIIGSHDMALPRILSAAGLLENAKIISVGSLRGLYAAARGEADIAPTHLLDEESGEYNKPVLDKLGLSGKVALIRGYARIIGFIVPLNNPLGIRSFEDILVKKPRIVNRNKGSGTRTFIDIGLRKAAERLGVQLDPWKIPGYTYEVRTHTAVAAAVAQGRADIGVGIEAAARIYRLGFIPLGREILDFAVPRERLSKTSISKFASTLRVHAAEVFRNLPGYSILDDTGRIIA